jgi:hypothetical protein
VVEVHKQPEGALIPAHGFIALLKEHDVESRDPTGPTLLGHRDLRVHQLLQAHADRLATFATARRIATLAGPKLSLFRRAAVSDLIIRPAAGFMSRHLRFLFGVRRLRHLAPLASSLEVVRRAAVDAADEPSPTGAFACRDEGSAPASPDRESISVIIGDDRRTR